MLGNDDLEQSITDRVEAVSEPKATDAGIPIADLDIECSGDGSLGRSKVAGHGDELAKSNHGPLASTLERRSTQTDRLLRSMDRR